MYKSTLYYVRHYINEHTNMVISVKDQEVCTGLLIPPTVSHDRDMVTIRFRPYHSSDADYEMYLRTQDFLQLKVLKEGTTIKNVPKDVENT